MNIRLMGYRCTGKTSVGRILASRLDLPFWDTDSLIEAESGQTIKEIVERHGWERFRALERKVILELVGMEDAIISLGGGAVVDPQNRRALTWGGINIWLIASPGRILQRMAQDPQSAIRRPPLSPLSPVEEIRRLLVEREPLYRRLAHFQVYTDQLTLEEIVEEIISSVKTHQGERPPSGDGCRGR